MSLASVAHLLPGDILVSNRRRLKLALNFAGAYYSPEWEVLTRERVRHIMLILFIQRDNLCHWTDPSCIGEKKSRAALKFNYTLE